MGKQLNSYLLSYFRTEAEALHLALSEDGLRWHALNGNRPVLSGTVGTKTLRDPCVFRATDGRFHLLATDGWRSDSIVHAVSADLSVWSEQRLIPVMANVPDTRNCWAPECFHDDETGLYHLIWSSSVGIPADGSDYDHRIWGATTPDFEDFTPAAPFFDPGYSVIDATVAKHDAGYLMAFKDERGENRPGTDHKAIRVCFAPHGGGPWTGVSEPITPPLTEGPALYRRDGGWTMIFDCFLDGRFDAVQSADGRRWAPVETAPAFPDGVRHAAVCEIDPVTAQRLRSANEVVTPRLQKGTM